MKDEEFTKIMDVLFGGWIQTLRQSQISMLAILTALDRIHQMPEGKEEELERIAEVIRTFLQKIRKETENLERRKAEVMKIARS
jgi:phosphoglycerate-specific signal transduction histidine kinase